MSQEKLLRLTSTSDPSQQYVLIERIGKGNYGTVHKAMDENTGEIVALKIVPMQDEEDYKQIITEIEILKLCRHENITNFLGAYLKNDDLWIAMEYCAGGSLCDMMKTTSKGLSEKSISTAIREILKGLEFLHHQNNIHRDIKGGNILVTGEGKIKITDFGVSARLSDKLSQKKTFAGTPYWMAPEVIGSQIEKSTVYGPKADIWSLGITAIELAEVTPPLGNLHPMRAMYLIPSQKPPKLQDSKKWSKHFTEFLKDTLVKNPAKRPSASELLKHPFITQYAHVDPTEVFKPLVTEIIETKKNRKRQLLRQIGVKEDVIENYLDEDRRLREKIQFEIHQSIMKPEDANNILEKVKKEEKPFSSLDRLIEWYEFLNEDPEDYGIETEEVTLESLPFKSPALMQSAQLFIPSNPAETRFSLEEVIELDFEDNFVCAQKIGGHILFGSESGLYVKEALGDLKPIFKGTKVLKMDLVEDMGVVIVLSGRTTPSVRVYETKDLLSVINLVSESSTANSRYLKNYLNKHTKLDGSKGCLDYKIYRMEESVFLVLVMKKSVIFFSWATHPFNKFMEVKEVAVSLSFTPGNFVEVLGWAEKIQKCIISSKEESLILDFESEECEPFLFNGEKKGTRSFLYYKDNQYIATIDGTTSIYSLNGASTDLMKIVWDTQPIFLAITPTGHLVMVSETQIEFRGIPNGEIVQSFSTQNKVNKITLLQSSRKGDLIIACSSKKYSFIYTVTLRRMSMS